MSENDVSSYLSLALAKNISSRRVSQSKATRGWRNENRAYINARARRRQARRASAAAAIKETWHLYLSRHKWRLRA
jgi:hypothetical protein